MWNLVCEKLPEENKVVNTKIDDVHGCRNEIKLYRKGSLWFYPMCRKTPCFSYGDIRHVHRIYASN